jgi:hypothetical protein
VIKDSNDKSGHPSSRPELIDNNTKKSPQADLTEEKSNTSGKTSQENIKNIASGIEGYIG